MKLNSRTGLGSYVGLSHPKTISEMAKPLAKRKKKQKKKLFFVDSVEHLNFVVKKDVWRSFVKRAFFNISNQFVIARVPRRWLYILDKSPITTPIYSVWMVNSGN